MFLRRLIILPDADQRVVDTVLKNSGNQQLEISNQRRLIISGS
jgi:hypothetical protein